MYNINKKTYKIILIGIMFSLVIVLSITENMLPQLPILPPNFKIGLSNIITMYSLFILNKKYAFLIAFLKSLFIFITKGPIAASLSISGGLFSVFVMIFLIYIFKNNISYITLSIFGAISHNLGQLFIAIFILSSKYLLLLIPILFVSGVIMGSITGLGLNIIMPILYKIYNIKSKL